MKPLFLVLLVVLGLTGWCFGPMLFDGRLPAYRDTADFYYPLFRFECDEWRAGRLPLWDPYSNLGMPLAASGTASVFYPGKILFRLPLDYDWAFRLYLVGHLLLAAGGAYRLARCCEASVTAAGIAAISYAFCGNVLFQHANIVFLVSAAWLPLAMEAALRMIRGRSVRWAVVLGAVLAMMILGGDPQAAYHAVLLAALYAVLLPGRERLRQDPPGPPSGGFEDARIPRFVRHICLLALAGVVALALSAIQILPSAEMTAHSDRVASSTARSLYEIPTALVRDNPARRVAAGLLCQLEEGTHHERVYRYSVAPWRLAEYVWPNSSGRQFSIHRRWLDAVDGENLVWVPSLYMGLLPLVLALAAFRLRRSDPVRVWLSWSVLLAVLASFGRYGLGWLAHGTWVAQHVGEPFGGLYWLLTVTLPGYIEFRYPAKLLVVAAMGLSVLAALGWDQVAVCGSMRLRRCLLGLAGISTIGVLAFLAIRPWWLGWFAGAEPDPLFGPLDARGAASDVLAALAQTALVALAAWWLVRRVSSARSWVGPAALVLVAVDLAAANGWLVATAPAIPPLTPPVNSSHAPAPSRAFRHSTWVPDAWSASSSPDRLHELARWNRQTAAPNHHLAERLALVEVMGTMNLYDYERLASVAELDAEKGRALIDLVGAEKLITPDPGRKPQNAATPIGVQVRSNPARFSRTWIVHDVVRLPALHESDPVAMAQRSVEVLQADGRPRDFRRQAVVESDLATDGRSTRKVSADGETCRVVHYDPLRVEVEAELAEPGLVVLSDQFYPGWRLSVASDGQPPHEAPIVRTNRVMRGVWLPAGRHRLVYQYRPTSFLLGATISGLGLLLSVLLLWRAAKRKS